MASMWIAIVNESMQQIGNVHKQDPFDISDDMEHDDIGIGLNEEGQGMVV